MERCLACKLKSTYEHCEICGKHHSDKQNCVSHPTLANSDPNMTVGELIEHKARWKLMIDQMKKPDGTPDLPAVNNHIKQLQDIVALKRSEIMEFQSYRNTIINVNDALLSEELRIANPSNAAVRSARQERNQFEKAIISYKKMGFKTDKIKKLMNTVFEKELSDEYIEGVN
jgi:hypothetical protein